MENHRTPSYDTTFSTSHQHHDGSKRQKSLLVPQSSPLGQDLGFGAPPPRRLMKAHFVPVARLHGSAMLIAVRMVEHQLKVVYRN